MQINNYIAQEGRRNKRGRMIYLILLMVLIWACESESKIDSIRNKNCEIECAQNLIHQFYRYNQKLEQESSSINRQDWYDSLNYYWDEMLISKQTVREYLLHVFYSKKKAKSLIYGWDFMSINTVKPLLDNNAHILFLLKALDEGDFLFASDQETKGLGFIRDYCSVFPVLILNGDTLPKVSRFTNSRGDTYPVFSQNNYVIHLDSIIEQVSLDNTYDFVDTSILWGSFKDSIWFDALLLKE